MHKSKNNGYIAVGIVVATIILFVGIMYSQINGSKIAENTYVGDVHIGSLTKEEAKTLLKNKVKMGIIELSYLDKKWEVNPSDIDASYDFDKTIEEAYNLNRNNNLFENLNTTIKTNFGAKNTLDMIVNYNQKKLEGKLGDIKHDIDVEVKDASLNINGSNITVNEGSTGIELDIKASLEKIKKQLETGIISDNLVINVIESKITKDELSNIDTVLGRYSTTIKASSAGRVANIKKSAQKMNGYLMMPGEEFSYVDITGPYTSANGYGNAPVIVEGELQSGIGGGVCQVSSTLYNSVLYAGLEIVEIKNHSIPSSYVGKGRDAVVNDSGVDFVFKNNLSQPVYIRSYASGTTVVTEIYGSSKDNQNIEIQTNVDGVSSASTKKVEDPTIEIGKEKVLEKGRDAYTVSTYRAYKDNDGKVIKREKVYTSYYPKKQSIIAVGTKNVEVVDPVVPEVPVEPVEPVVPEVPVEPEIPIVPETPVDPNVPLHQ